MPARRLIAFPVMQTQHATAFNPEVYLGSSGASRRIAEFRPQEALFSQGNLADSVMYIQKGRVKFTVVNGFGKEAVVAIFGPGDFLGEASMTSQTVRVLQEESELSDRFITCMLARNTRVEADLIDQLFNSTEKRLARTLLLLARYGKEDQSERVLQKVSQETLAEMIGTTRSRVNLFMTKFRKLGFIEYNGGIKINKSLLTVVLHE